MQKDNKEILSEKVRDYRARTAALRERYDRVLATGIFTADLTAELSALQKEKEALLTECLPLIRRRFLDRMDRAATCTVLVAPKGYQGPLSGDLTGDVLQEAGLSKEELSLIRKLEDGEAKEAELPEDLTEALETRQISCYLAAGDGTFFFVFDEEGNVYLAEDNDGWQVRKDPLFTGILAENAIRETDHSVLVLDADHRVLRLSCARILTPEDAERLPLYG
jgi:hypothetical protein